MRKSVSHMQEVYILLKGLHMGFYIYINLGTLPLCTKPWNDTSCINSSWYLCLDSYAFWWIRDVYRHILISNITQTFQLLTSYIKLTNNPYTYYENRSVLKAYLYNLQFTVESHTCYRSIYLYNDLLSHIRHYILALKVFIRLTTPCS